MDDQKLVKDEPGLNQLGFIVGGIVLLFVWAWTVMTAWEWLLVPILGLPVLNMAETFSVLAMAAVFNGSMNREKFKFKDSTVEDQKGAMFHIVTKIILVLTTTWIIHFFI